MKSTKIFLYASLVVLISTSCYKKGGPWGIRGKGETISEVRDVTGFNKIDLPVDANIYFTEDSVYYVKVTAQENIVKIVQTKVNGNELQIDFLRNVWDHEEIKIEVHAPKLVGLDISGSGEVTVKNTLHTAYLSVNVSGSGDISIAGLQAAALDVKISGSSDIQIDSGDTKNEDFNISGSGNIDVLGVKSTNSKIKVSGSGDVKVYVTDYLDVHISGSGDISYKGHPDIDTDISGSGKLINLN
ncbi:MAG: DUF2807 domain-containing protein [Bacteroidia bacterium]|nr:DUF2807 domain-containing protein [Bacteroidia bacterium]